MFKEGRGGGWGAAVVVAGEVPDGKGEGRSSLAGGLTYTRADEWYCVYLSEIPRTARVGPEMFGSTK